MKARFPFSVRWVTLVLLVNASCAFDPTISFYIEPGAAPYVEKFYEEAAARGVSLQRDNLTVGFREINGGFGVTDKTGPGINVAIEQKLLTTYGPGYAAEIEVIIFHELGHALLNREHDDTHQTIMRTTPSITCYKDNVDLRASYLDELFKVSSEM